MTAATHETGLALSRRQLFGSAFAASAMMVLPAAVRAQVATASSIHPNWPAVSDLMAKYLDAGKLANIVTALGYGQEAPQFLAGGTTSFSSSTAVGPDTLYRIYSMTKPITGMATVMCIDDGLLSLDQPIADFIPGFAKMQVQKEYDGAITAGNLEPAVRQITVRHCLTHTAGLGYSIVQQGPISDAYTAAGLVPAQASRISVPGIMSGKPASSLAAFAEGLAEMPLVYQPGTKWSYSVGLDLLGRVIEIVSGKSFDAFLAERIFEPCGMASTWFRVPESQKQRLTANYVLANDTLVPIDLPDNSIYLDEPAFPFGGAGLVSTARDYDRFLQMLGNYGVIDGTRVMSEPAVRLATSDLFADTMANGGGFQFGAMRFGYGAGGLVGTGIAAGLFGWFGAASTCGLVNMKNGLRHNLMTQAMGMPQDGLQQEFPFAVAADAARQSASA